ncbi:hypothetical protein [uncultured Algoriphagus sp.]|uniref:hypothetical protein n=1 Tax=uncultured Algoriphagus sp. TaxID=417365 RepID=UPI0030EE62A4|tara:strand:- start:41654 stop:42748 length:1095 start_codon:yes stop_codon:yes gene_type:complete
MKKLFLFGLIITVFTSCTYFSQEEILNPKEEKSGYEKPIANLILDYPEVEGRMQVYAQLNEERLTNASPITECSAVTKVPSEYPTIQEAVDHVTAGGTVIVSAGSYFEEVYINKPGIKLKALDEVELYGGFILNEEADETSVHNFKIILRYDFNGILSYKADKLHICENEIDVYPFIRINAIVLGMTNESYIHKNKIYGANNGISLFSYNGVVSHKNTLEENSISEFTNVGILLGGNMDENLLLNNSVVDAASYRLLPYGNIVLVKNETSTSDDTCDNNLIKGNVASRGTNGLIIDDDNAGNEIIGNEFSENIQYGIYASTLKQGSDPNIFKENKALGNTGCDIVDESSKNVYNNNTFGCTTEK